MINPKQLLSDLQRLLKKLEDDLRLRCTTNKEIDSKVRAEYTKAKSGGRTSSAYEVWRDEFITQVAVAWILGCVFVRFLEDNQLIDTPRLAGPTKERLDLARDHHTIYFREHPTESDREYLEHVFREAARSPGVKELFDERHNPLWGLGISGDGATMLLNFWQQIEPATGALAHEFTDEEWNTRFLGDLYQDLSESARKKYALLQTPIFVEEFILDRTLTPAIEEFGYQSVRLIDPACGSGHFLLGAFRRLFELWLRNEPGTNPRMLAQKALASVFGVDLNPYAAAVARFRLLVAALKASGVTRMKDAPDFKINVAVGDSLLHGDHQQDQLKMRWHPIAHMYETEDKEQLDRILKSGHYHAVVGNPPYITVKDPALNKAYRERFGSCHRKYSLAVPFMERFFDLAMQGSGTGHEPAGFVGMITSNSFMKREMGKKLIENYIAHWDLTHVIDTSGAHIPNHGKPKGTPTAILFARNRHPIGVSIRAVLGIKSEPGTPTNPANGYVWSAILNQVDLPGSQSEFVSVADTPRASFHKHPWSIGGGGAAELKEILGEAAERILMKVSTSIGFSVIMGEDEAFIVPRNTPRGRRLSADRYRSFVEGKSVRHWSLTTMDFVIFPYDQNIELVSDRIISDLLWEVRTILWARVDFNKQTYREAGRTFWEYHQIPTERNRLPLLITFADLATHNNFVLARGGKIFNRHAPIICLPRGSSENDHLRLLGLLNCSTACFWGRQTFFPRGGFSAGKWQERLEWDGTKLQQFPIPKHQPLELARTLDQNAQELEATLPAALAHRATPNKVEWQHAEQHATQILARMIALQEELDWKCYELYGLTPDELTLPIEKVPPIHLGERAFEIVMARQMSKGELETTWFERHGSTAITQLPEHWPVAYRDLVMRRIDLIESDRNLALIEQPEYKRRWNTESWASQQERALREWLVNRLEDARYWTELRLTSCARLADRVQEDGEFMQVAEFYRGRKEFDVLNLTSDLIRSEAVRFLVVLRYKQSGLRTRAIWEVTWEKQRAEDAIDARAHLPEGHLHRLTIEQAAQLKRAQIGDIPVPPKYKSTDFQDPVYWRLRGALDVPKERFISYPHCERDADPSLVIAWAGWNHLQQAQALAAYYESVRSKEGWSTERLVPLLAGLLELVPWLLQWHNEIDPHYNQRMGDFFKSFVEEEARSMSKTIEEIRGWKP
jgi:Domain of unknown function (DUF7008)/Eco57I restriction-modification methylase